MRVIGTILILALALAVIRAVLIAITIATVLALLLYFATKPREALLFVGALVITNLAIARPVVLVVMLCIVCAAVMLAGRMRKPAPLLRHSGRQLR